MNPETTSWVNRVLDRAERPRLFPAYGGAAIGVGVAWAVAGFWWAWPVLAVGVVLTLIRPVGTSVRRRVLIRQARRTVARSRVR